MVRIRATELHGVAGLLKTLLPCTVLGKALCSAPLWWAPGTAAVLTFFLWNFKGKIAEFFLLVYLPFLNTKSLQI